MLFRKLSSDNDIKESQKLKQVFAVGILSLIVLSLLAAVVVYTINSTQMKVVKAASKSENVVDVCAQDNFLSELKNAAPEYSVERVSYSAYVIDAGDAIGEVTMCLSTNEDGSLEVMLQYPYVSSYFELIDDENSIIKDYIDEARDEVALAKYNDIAESFSVVIGAFAEYNVSEEDKNELVQAVIDAMKNEGSSGSIYMGITLIDIVNNDEDETVRVTMRKVADK